MALFFYRIRMKLFFLLSYYNIHFTPFLDALAQIEGVEIKVGLLNPLAKFRPGYDWDVYLSSDTYIRIYENPKLLTSEFLRKYHYIGFLGLVGESILYRTALRALYFTNAQVLVFSEGWKQKSGFSNFSRKLALLPFNRKKVSLFAVGANAYDDYKNLGMTKWKAYRFGFTVFPPVKERHYQVQINEEVKFLYIGQLIERKRILDLIEAFERCANRNDKVSLSIYGTGKQEEAAKELVNKLKINNKVAFWGFIPSKELYSKLGNYDCLVLPSQYDGWGAVVNEAMQNGLAVIVSDGVRARQIVQEGENGFHFPVGKIEVLAHKMHLLVANREMLYSFKSKSSELIIDYYPESLAKKVYQLLEAKINGSEEPKFESSLKVLSV